MTSFLSDILLPFPNSNDLNNCEHVVSKLSLEELEQNINKLSTTEMYLILISNLQTKGGLSGLMTSVFLNALLKPLELFSL